MIHHIGIDSFLSGKYVLPWTVSCLVQDIVHTIRIYALRIQNRIVLRSSVLRIRNTIVLRSYPVQRNASSYRTVSVLETVHVSGPLRDSEIVESLKGPETCTVSRTETSPYEDAYSSVQEKPASLLYRGERRVSPVQD